MTVAYSLGHSGALAWRAGIKALRRALPTPHGTRRFVALIGLLATVGLTHQSVITAVDTVEHALGIDHPASTVAGYVTEDHRSPSNGNDDNVLDHQHVDTSPLQILASAQSAENPSDMSEVLNPAMVPASSPGNPLRLFRPPRHSLANVL